MTEGGGKGASCMRSMRSLAHLGRAGMPGGTGRLPVGAGGGEGESESVWRGMMAAAVAARVKRGNMRGSIVSGFFFFEVVVD